MIGPNDSAGGDTDSALEWDCLAGCVLGATYLKGWAVTPSVRYWAQQLVVAFKRGDEAAQLEAFAALGLHPDDVLPPDDAALDAVLGAAEEVERRGDGKEW